MSDEQQGKQESQKTLIAFVAGLLIGGLLVWVFSGTAQENQATVTPDNASSQQEDTQMEDSQTTEDSGDISGASITQVTEGSVSVRDQAASDSVTLASATFPTDEGWVGVRAYNNGEMGNLLGVVRYSKTQELIPDTIYLQYPTTAGDTYAVVFYTENGDHMFGFDDDIQIGGAADTFTAQ